MVGPNPKLDCCGVNSPDFRLLEIYYKALRKHKNPMKAKYHANRSNPKRFQV